MIRTLRISGLIVGALFLLGFVVLPMALQATSESNLLGIQMRNNSCNSSGQGSAEFTPDIDGSWSDLAYSSWEWEPDCSRVKINDVPPASKDIRIRLQAYDRYRCGFMWLSFCSDWGDVERTDWASQGNSWTGWSTNPTADEPNQWRIRIDSRNMPTDSSITDIRIGIQIADNGNRTGCKVKGDQKYTDWTSDGGGWSSWASDGAAVSKFNCARIKLVTVISPNPSAVISAVPSSVTEGGTADISYTVSNVESCTLTGTNGDSWSGITGSGSQTSSELYSDTQFTINCSGSGGVASDNADVSVETLTPSVSVSVSPSQVTEGETVTVSYEASNVSACSLTGTNGDLWEGFTGIGSYTSSPIEESTSYTLSCNGYSSTIVVSAVSEATGSVNLQCVPTNFCVGDNLYSRSAMCTETLQQTCAYQCSGSSCVVPPDPELTLRATPPVANEGGTTLLRYTVEYVDSCTLTGTNGDSWSGISSSGTRVTGILDEETDYTLACIGLDGETEAYAYTTVHIVPKYQEI